jgi:branched-chain amino acid transport system permease protein
MGEPVLILAFVVIVIGGIGSIKGALVGSLLVGLTDTLGGIFLPELFKLFMAPGRGHASARRCGSMAIYILMGPRPDLAALGPFRSARMIAERASTPWFSRASSPCRSVAPCAGRTFTITLATRAAILALAAVGLNIALGIGGHGQLRARGVLRARRLRDGDPGLSRADLHAADLGFLTIEGTKSMPVIWLVAVVASALSALVIGLLSLRTSGVYFIMITLAFGQMLYYFADLLERLWRRGRAVDLGAQRVSGAEHARPDPVLRHLFRLPLLALFLQARLRGSPFGLALNAARQTPARVETVGLDPMRLKLRLRDLGGDHRACRGALRRSQPLRQPHDVQLAPVGRDHRAHHHRGRRAAVGPGDRRVLFVALEHWLGGLSDYWHIWSRR